MIYWRPTSTLSNSFGQPRRSSTFDLAHSTPRSQDADPSSYIDVASTVLQGSDTRQDQIDNQAHGKPHFALDSWMSKIDKLTPKQQALFLQNRHPEGFQDYVSKLQDIVQKRVDNSKLFELTRKIKPFYDLVNLVTPIVSEVSQSCPVPPSAILGGITCILSLGVRMDEYQDRIIQTFVSMASELSIIDKYRAESLFTNDPNVQTLHIDIAADILDFCIAVAKMFFDDEGKEKKSLLVFLKAQWKSFDAVLGNIKAEFHRHIIELDKLIILANSRRLRAIERGVEAVGEKMQFDKHERSQMVAEMKDADYRQALEERRNHILKWLPSLPGGRIQEDTYERRVEGSGEWLIEHVSFKSWFEEPASTVLWVYGKPGCGKSHLASRVIHDLGARKPSSDSALVYLYCSSTQYTVRMDLNSLLGSILGQLYLQLPSSTELESLVQSFISGNKESPSRAKMKEWIWAALEKLQFCYIIIDGLDECSNFEDRHFEDFCSFLASLVKHDLPQLCVKILVFSRPNYQVITRTFDCFPQIQVDNGANEDDIKSYISDKVDEVNLDPSPEEHQGFAEIKELMLNKAGGTFLWVRLKVKEFRDIGSVDDIKEALQEPIEGLDELYGQAIERISRRPKYSRDRALRTLLWVANAYRSLSKLELLEALSTKPGRKGLSATQRLSRDLPLSTECLDLITEVDGYYQLIHGSLKDFLLSQAPGSSDYGKHQLKAHEIMAETCLTYLTFEVFHSVSISKPDGLKNLLQEYPLLEYAALYWGDHFALAYEREAEPLNRLVRGLFRSDAIMTLCIDILEYEELCRGKLSQFNAATPLHLLAIFNLRALAETMPEFLDLINEHDQFLHLPIDYAIIYEAMDMVAWLLDVYLRQKDKDEEPFATCLDCCQILLLDEAISSDWGDIVRVLLSIGVNVDWVDCPIGSGKTTVHPVYLAVDKDAYSSLDALLEANIKIDPLLRDPKDSALRLAVRKGSLRAVKLLLAAGVDVENVGSDGWTILQCAAAYGDPDVIFELLRKSSEVTLSTTPQLGENALHIAATKGNFKAAEQLLAHCQSLKFVDALNFDGRTPLMKAFEHSSFDIALLILEHGARYDISNWAQVVPKSFFSELCKKYSSTCSSKNIGSDTIIETLLVVSEAETEKPIEHTYNYQELTGAPKLLEIKLGSEHAYAHDILYKIWLEGLTKGLKAHISAVEEGEAKRRGKLDHQLWEAYSMLWQLSQAILGQTIDYDMIDSVRMSIESDMEMISDGMVALTPHSISFASDSDSSLGYSQRDEQWVSQDLTNKGPGGEELDAKRLGHDNKDNQPDTNNRTSQIQEEELWTEISDSLVIEQALERMGYEYDRTAYYFYVKKYLVYDQVLELFELSDAMRLDQRNALHVQKKSSWRRFRLYKYDRRGPDSVMWPDLESREIESEQENEETWTEIWDHLISREAIDKLGYDFERTKYYFYIKKRLSRDQVNELIDLSNTLQLS